MRAATALLSLCALVASLASAATVGGIEVESGKLVVPENRARKTGRTVTIPYYRLHSTAAKPAAPFFFLAGGPGDSWIDLFEDENFRAQALFFRQFGDVVLFDQRGSEHARPSLRCPGRVSLPLNEATTSATYVRAMRIAAKECRAHFEREGIDLTAYNTLENAADVDELRRKFGYKQVTLVGGSYGTHLALAIVRTNPGIVAGAILAGVEGPDHTYDMPSQVLAAYVRLAAEAEALPAFRARLPAGGIIAAIREIEARFDRSPPTITVEHDGEKLSVTLGKFDVQGVIPSGALNRDNLAWPARMIEIYEGDYARLARDTIESRRQHLDAMYYMMDCGSGVSAKRLARIRSDAVELAALEILGDINEDYDACDAWRSPDLGEEFRSDVVAATPVLIFQGTWDFATPMENAQDVVRGLKNGHLVKVERGSHLTIKDLQKLWPPFAALIGDFARGKASQVPARIELPEGNFRPPN